MDQELFDKIMAGFESSKPWWARGEGDNAFVRGVKTNMQGAGIARSLATGDYEAAARKVRDLHAYQQRNRPSEDQQRLLDAYENAEGSSIAAMGREFLRPVREGEGLAEKAKGLAGSMSGMGAMLAEQLPNMAMPMLGQLGGQIVGRAGGGLAGGAAGSAVPGVGNATGAAVGGVVGGLGGGWAGASLGNAVVELPGYVTESLREAGIDPGDTDAVREHLAANRGEIFKKAGIKGSIIGAVDVASLGLGSKILRGPGKKVVGRALADMGIDTADRAAVRAAMQTPEFAQRLATDAAFQASQRGARRLARNTAAFMTEPGGEYLGEFLGTLAADGDWSPEAIRKAHKEGVLEAFMSLGQSGTTFAGQKAWQYATSPSRGQQRNADDGAAAPPDSGATGGSLPTADEFQATGNGMPVTPENSRLAAGEMTPEMRRVEGEVVQAEADAARHAQQEAEYADMLGRNYPAVGEERGWTNGGQGEQSGRRTTPEVDAALDLLMLNARTDEQRKHAADIDAVLQMEAETPEQLRFQSVLGATLLDWARRQREEGGQRVLPEPARPEYQGTGQGMPVSEGTSAFNRPDAAMPESYWAANDAAAGRDAARAQAEQQQAAAAQQQAQTDQSWADASNAFAQPPDRTVQRDTLTRAVETGSIAPGQGQRELPYTPAMTWDDVQIAHAQDARNAALAEQAASGVLGKSLSAADILPGDQQNAARLPQGNIAATALDMMGLSSGQRETQRGVESGVAAGQQQAPAYPGNDPAMAAAMQTTARRGQVRQGQQQQPVPYPGNPQVPAMPQRQEQAAVPQAPAQASPDFAGSLRETGTAVNAAGTTYTVRPMTSDPNRYQAIAVGPDGRRRYVSGNKGVSYDEAMLAARAASAAETGGRLDADELDREAHERKQERGRARMNELQSQTWGPEEMPPELAERLDNLERQMNQGEAGRKFFTGGQGEETVVTGVGSTNPVWMRQVKRGETPDPNREILSGAGKKGIIEVLRKWRAGKTTRDFTARQWEIWIALQGAAWRYGASDQQLDAAFAADPDAAQAYEDYQYASRHGFPTPEPQNVMAGELNPGDQVLIRDRQGDLDVATVRKPRAGEPQGDIVLKDGVARYYDFFEDVEVEGIRRAGEAEASAVPQSEPKRQTEKKASESDLRIVRGVLDGDEKMTKRFNAAVGKKKETLQRLLEEERARRAKKEEWADNVIRELERKEQEARAERDAYLKGGARQPQPQPVTDDEGGTGGAASGGTQGDPTRRVREANAKKADEEARQLRDAKNPAKHFVDGMLGGAFSSVDLDGKTYSVVWQGGDAVLRVHERGYNFGEYVEHEVRPHKGVGAGRNEVNAALTALDMANVPNKERFLEEYKDYLRIAAGKLNRVIGPDGTTYTLKTTKSGVSAIEITGPDGRTSTIKPEHILGANWSRFEAAQKIFNHIKQAQPAGDSSAAARNDRQAERAAEQEAQSASVDAQDIPKKEKGKKQAKQTEAPAETEQRPKPNDIIKRIRSAKTDAESPLAALPDSALGELFGNHDQSRGDIGLNAFSPDEQAILQQAGAVYTDEGGSRRVVNEILNAEKDRRRANKNGMSADEAQAKWDDEQRAAREKSRREEDLRRARAILDGDPTWTKRFNAMKPEAKERLQKVMEEERQRREAEAQPQQERKDETEVIRSRRITTDLQTGERVSEEESARLEEEKIFYNNQQVDRFLDELDERHRAVDAIGTEWRIVENDNGHSVTRQARGEKQATEIASGLTLEQARQVVNERFNGNFWGAKKQAEIRRKNEQYRKDKKAEAEEARQTQQPQPQPAGDSSASPRNDNQAERATEQEAQSAPADGHGLRMQRMRFKAELARSAGADGTHRAKANGSTYAVKPAKGGGYTITGNNSPLLGDEKSSWFRTLDEAVRALTNYVFPETDAAAGRQPEPEFNALKYRYWTDEDWAGHKPVNEGERILKEFRLHGRDVDGNTFLPVSLGERLGQERWALTITTKDGKRHRDVGASQNWTRAQAMAAGESLANLGVAGQAASTADNLLKHGVALDSDGNALELVYENGNYGIAVNNKTPTADQWHGAKHIAVEEYEERRGKQAAERDGARPLGRDEIGEAPEGATARNEAKEKQPVPKKGKKEKGIADKLGEHIGGSRADLAQKTGPRKVGKGLPEWAEGYEIRDGEDGRYIVFYKGDPILRWFSSAEEAEKYLRDRVAGEFFYVTYSSSDQAYTIAARPQRNARRGIYLDERPTFSTKEEAQRYLLENMERLMAARAEKVAGTRRPRQRGFGERDLVTAETTERVGKERRTGDATPDDFMSAFGFRGVEFGLWNNQKERQALLNDAYDALMDLADLLNIPARALSLNGELALAFGARGKGGSTRAHYEPLKVVINLTKTSGKGSLAHEWLHALDHYFGGRGERKGPISEHYNPKPPENVRPEVYEAFKKIMNAIVNKPDGGNRTDYYRAALRFKNSDYWANRRELLARAFSAYIEDTMAERGEKSNFLSYGSSNAQYGDEWTAKPYPEGEERQAINKAFREFFDTLKVDDSEGRAALYSIEDDGPTRANGRPARREGESLSDYNRRVKAWNDRRKAELKAATDLLGRLVPGLSVRNTSDLDGDIKKLKGRVRQMRNSRGLVIGAYHPGTKTVLLTSDADAATVLHEIGWHAVYDWARTNAPELYRQMRDYAQSAPESVKQWVRERYGDFSAEALLDEIGAKLFTESGRKEFEQAVRDRAGRSWYQKVTDLLRDLWNRFTGANRADLGAYRGLSPEAAMGRLMEDIKAGRRLGESRASRAEDRATRDILVRYAKLLGVSPEQLQAEYDAVVERYKDTPQWLKAPNGEDSNLNERQWVLVRTPRFKAWFGDWENDPENASKMTDANGEPMVVYHQTGEDFTVFEPRRPGAGQYDEQLPFGIFLKPDDGDIGLRGKRQMALFANIKNPFRVADRAELVEYLKRNIPDYADLLLENDRQNAEYRRRMDALRKEVARRYDEWKTQHPGEGRRNDIRLKIQDELGERALSDEWIAAENNLAAQMKELVDKHFRESGYDGIILERDEGGFGKKTTRSIIAFERNQVKSATDNTGAFDPNDPDIRYTFAGEQGAAALDAAEEGTHRLDNLAVAREMEAAGKDAKAVKLATGWERGKDGKWRYEIDDSANTFHFSGDLVARRDWPGYAEDVDRINELGRKAGSAMLFGTEGLTEAEKTELDRLRQKRRGDMEHWRQRMERGNARLMDVLDAPELFRAYPQLEDVRVVFDENMLDGTRGAYSKEGNRIALNPKLLYKQGDIRSVLHHEVQHAIQYIEGFAVGTNAFKIWLYSEYSDADVKAGLKTVLSDHSISMDDEDIDALVSIYWEWKRSDGASGDADNRFNDIVNKYGLDEKTQVDLFDDTKYANIAYERNAGETEARNTSRRLIMTAEERRASLAEETEDVAREDQIVLERMLGGAAASADSPSPLRGQPPQRGSLEVGRFAADGQAAQSDEPRRENGRPARKKGEALKDYNARVTKWRNEQREEEVIDLFQAAYHGSPFRFDEFTLEHISEGEGGQLHGWGLYFALDKEVGDEYRDKLTHRERRRQNNPYTVNGRRVEFKNGKWIWVDSGNAMSYADGMAMWINFRFEDEPGGGIAVLEKQKKDFEEWAEAEATSNGADESASASAAKNLLLNTRGYQDVLNAIKFLKENDIQRVPFGQTYRVDIPEDAEMLREDAPLDRQPEVVQKAIATLLGDEIEGERTGTDLYRALAKKLGSPEAASKALNEAGVKGIRYDGGLDGECAVVFDDQAIEIMQTYYQAEQAGLNPLEALKKLYGQKRAEAGQAAARQTERAEGVFPHRREGESLRDYIERRKQWAEGRKEEIWRQVQEQIRKILPDKAQANAIIGIIEARAKSAGISAAEFVHRRGLEFRQGRTPGELLAQGERLQGSFGLAAYRNEGRAIISAFEAADVSTLAHELAHMFRQDLERFGQTELLRMAEKWAGVKDGKWTREQEEMFARAFERYLREGKAPTKELRGVFARFRDWLTNIYRTLKGSPLDVRLSPEITRVFDALLTENAALDRGDALGMGAAENAGDLNQGKGQVGQSGRAGGNVTQRLTSEKTSLPQNDPALYKSKWFNQALKPGAENFDIGAGKTTKPTERLAALGVTNVPFDPFNREQGANAQAIQDIVNGKRYPTVTVANVLNVIAEPESRSNVILQAAKALAQGGKAFFDVYVAPKEGETKTGTYQTAMKPEQYIPEIERWFNKVERHGSILIASDPKAEALEANRASWWDANPAQGGNTVLYQTAPNPANNNAVTGQSFIDRILDNAAPKWRDLWERFIYNFIDSNDPRERVWRQAGSPTDQDFVTIERLRGKKTAAEQKRFRETMLKPLLETLGKGKLSVSDLEEYAWAMHTAERNQRMREVNAKRNLDEAAKNLDDAERQNLKAQMEFISKQGAANGWTQTDIHLAYLDLLNDVFNGIPARETAQRAAERALSPNSSQAQIDRVAKGRERLEALKKHRARWNEESVRFAGQTDQEAAATIQKWQRDGRYAALQRAHRQMADISNATLDVLHDAGELDDEEWQGMKNGYQYYVPLHRDGFLDTTPIRLLQTAKGSKRAVVNILPNVVRSHDTAIARKYKIEAGRALYEFAKANPDAGISIEELEKKPTHDREGNIVMYTSQAEPEDGVFIRYGGRKMLLRFAADTRTMEGRTLGRFLDSVKGADASLNGLTKMLHGATRWLSAVNTSLNPEFVITNFSRDLQTAFIHLNQKDINMDGLQKAVAKDMFPAMRGIFAAERGNRNSVMARWYADYEKSGGKVGWAQNYEEVVEVAEEIQRELKLHQKGHHVYKAYRRMRDLVDHANASIENCMRLATYKALVERGVSRQKAAMVASSLTVDFTQHGKMSPQINSLYMFFNASVQGTVRMVQALASSKKVRAIAGGIAGAGFVLQMLALAGGGDDDSGEPYILGIPDAIRERNIIIMLPGGEGKYIKIPKAYGYGALYDIGAELANSIYMGAQGRKYSHTAGAMRVVNSFANSFNPIQSATILQTLAPTLLDPVVYVSENKSWTGQPLMPEQNPYGPQKPDSERAWKGTSPIWKKLAQTLNHMAGGDAYSPGKLAALTDWSPETFSMLWDNATGGMGRFIGNVVALPLTVASGDTEAHRVPFARQVYGEWQDRAISSRYYEAMDRAEVAHMRFKNAENLAERKRLYQEPDHKLYLQSRQAERQIRLLRKRQQFMEAAGDRDGAERVRKRIVERQAEVLKMAV